MKKKMAFIWLVPKNVEQFTYSLCWLMKIAIRTPLYFQICEIKIDHFEKG